MVSGPNLPLMSRGEIALQVLRGRPAAPAAEPKILQSGMGRPDPASSHLLRMERDHADNIHVYTVARHAYHFAPGWEVNVVAEGATRTGSVALGGARATGAGQVTLQETRIHAEHDSDLGYSPMTRTATETTTTAFGALTLDLAGLAASAAASGTVAVHVHQNDLGGAAYPEYSRTTVTGESAGGVNLSVAFREVGELSVQTGEGDDSLSVSATQVFSIDAGGGRDAIAVASAGNVRAVDAGTGDDAVAISAAGSVNAVDGGAGRDAIVIMAGAYAFRVDGGEGDDVLTVSAAVADRISGGDGDDAIRIRAETIDQVSGGRGDDHLALDSTSGRAVTLYLAEGDGRDTVDTNGPLLIKRYAADGASRAEPGFELERHEDGGLTIRFAGSNDSVRIDATGALAGRELAVSVERDGSLHVHAAEA